MLHWKAHMPKHIHRHQNHPSGFSSFEVMSKNVYFGSQKQPFWKIQTSDGFENCSIGKLICQILFLDTKISLLATIVLKLWAKLDVRSHVTKNAITRPLWFFSKFWKVVHDHIIWYYKLSKYDMFQFYGLGCAVWYTFHIFKVNF